MSGRLSKFCLPFDEAPVYKKKGSSVNPTNYRPISLLSAVSKVLEALVYEVLYKHVGWILPVKQSGFRHCDRAVLQLDRIVHNLTFALERGETIVACFYDLFKAFDRVWHAGLIAKLQHYGVSKTAMAWFEEYLTERKQRVRVGEATSTWKTIPAGVPQGSVLGPLLSYLHC